MRKNIAIFLSFIFISITSVKAETMVGITGAYHMFDVEGSETTRSSAQVNNGKHSDEALVPEFLHPCTSGSLNPWIPESLIP